jgi:Allene oxide cyclase barrel like domain
MRSKLGICGALMAILAAAVLAFGATVASAHGKSGHQTLRLVATEIQSEFLDVGAEGPSLGDRLVISETLAKRGRDVGTSGVVCTITGAEPPYEVLTFQCVATLSLRNGQITLQGLIEVQGENDPGPFTVAITGGTGAYRGAGGEAVVRDTSDTTSTYKLRFDSAKKKHRR